MQAFSFYLYRLMSLCQGLMSLLSSQALYDVRCNISDSQKNIAYLSMFSDRFQSPIPVGHASHWTSNSISINPKTSSRLNNSAKNSNDLISGFYRKWHPSQKFRQSISRAPISPLGVEKRMITTIGRE